MLKELTMDELLREPLQCGLGVTSYIPKALDNTDDRIEKAKLKVQLKEVRALLEKRQTPRQQKTTLASFEPYLSSSDWIPRSGSVGLFYSSGLQGRNDGP